MIHHCDSSCGLIYSFSVCEPHQGTFLIIVEYHYNMFEYCHIIPALRNLRMQGAAHQGTFPE